MYMIRWTKSRHHYTQYCYHVYWYDERNLVLVITGYNVYDTMNEISSSDRSYIVYCTAPNPFHCVQPDDGLLEGETCSC
jgi:hypothetical protein